MKLEELKKPFPAKDIEWRIQSAGTKNGKIWAMVLAYVDNRAIMDRLDEVCTPSGWKNEYTKAPDGGILCGLTIKVENEWITKWDGAENTEIESVKGGLSNAMKRAAVQWGVGRYLYDVKESFIDPHPQGKYRQKAKTNGKYPGQNYEAFKWNPPLLPAWALPDGEKQDAPPKAEAIPDPYDKPLPDFEKEYFLAHPDLSDKQKEYIRTHPMTENLKNKIDEQIAGQKAGQKEMIY